MKKIVTILGARPQFVKAAVLSRIVSEMNQIQEVIVHTGQHFDANMSAVFFNEMQIPTPKYNLAIHGLTHGAMTGQMLEKIETILIDEKPDAVVVYGDTNSTLAGALAAKKLDIKVIHIEAGLRSFNLKMPEEVNRILTDRISALLSCPTDTALQNLANEGFGILPIIIEKHGDIMKDAVAFYSEKSSEKSTIIQDLYLSKDAFVLTTIHRQENTDDEVKMKEIFAALDEINQTQQVVLPLHPRTKKMLTKFKINTKITFIEPVGYFDMLELLKNCTMVVTDSGGLQKEAFFSNKNCIIVREETEWLELVTHNFAKIVGTNKENMLSAFQYFLTAEMDFSINLFGKNVGKKIHDSICNLIQD
tara:strand:+ start:2284 stop:3369 length:1086 start_codon:yes stop_codon:yes gene_type:complete